MKIEDITLEDIQDFIHNGSRKDAPSEVVETLSKLEKIHGMYLRWQSRDHIIKHLEKVDGYSYYLANKWYDMMTEYFYAERQVSKQAHKNRLAEKLENGITLALKLAESSKDVVMALGKIKDIAEILEINKEDAMEFPEELLAKPFKMYSVDAEFLGLPKPDRYKLARFIDEYPELSEKERNSLREEADLLPFKLFKPDHENPRLQEK
jgi:hypothetical protein